MIDILKKYLLEELEKQSFFSNALVVIHKNNTWIDSKTDEQINDSKILLRLRSKTATEKYKKFRDPWQVLFWAQKSNIAIIVDVPKKTQESTINKKYDLLLACINIATKSYYANHDTLTGVLNRHGIQWELERVNPNLLAEEDEAISFDQQLPSDNEIALFAFDIDRFKCINDSYSHDVGDAILVMFAARLTAKMTELQTRFGVSCVFGRPGGEEFELVARGKVGTVPVTQIVEELLNSIREPVLPSADDIKKYQKRNPTSPALKELPKITNPITASIGVATQVIKKPEKATEEMYYSLRRDADVALYRAKNDGRNRHRLFKDIRMKHGRVHEFHSDSDLAIIDIGSDVGVELGDIYRVFFPPFQNEAIRIGDERSTKTLGKYPMIESARLIVIERQEEVSICAVIDKATSSDIPKGALLQYVHSGSIPFLHPRPRQWALNVLPAESIHDYIEQLQREELLYSVIRVKGHLRAGDQRDRDYRISEVIAAIYLLFPDSTKVFGGNGSGLYLLLKSCVDQSPSTEERMDLIKERLGALSVFLGEIRAGVFIPGVIEEEISLSGESILFYCTAALNTADDEDPDNTISFFNEDTPGDTIYKWRAQRMIEDALVDYQKFKSCGFDLSGLDNQLGLAILEGRLSEYYPLGEVAFSVANKAEPSEKVYQANLALMKAIRGDYESAYNLFIEIEDFVSESLTKIYGLAFAKSALDVALEGQEEIDNVLKEKLNSALEHYKTPLSDITYDSWRQDIMNFLNSSN